MLGQGSNAQNSDDGKKNNYLNVRYLQEKRNEEIRCYRHACSGAP